MFHGAIKINTLLAINSLVIREQEHDRINHNSKTMEMVHISMNGQLLLTSDQFDTYLMTQHLRLLSGLLSAGQEACPYKLRQRTVRFLSQFASQGPQSPVHQLLELLTKLFAARDIFYIQR